jgi:hypothetical protein
MVLAENVLFGGFYRDFMLPDTYFRSQAIMLIQKDLLELENDKSTLAKNRRLETFWRRFGNVLENSNCRGKERTRD